MSRFTYGPGQGGNSPFGGTPPRGPNPQLDIPDVGRKVTIITALVVVGFVLWSSTYTVGPDEEAVVLRLGRLEGAPRLSGFHFKLPAPVDRVFKVATKKVHKEEFGFRTTVAAVRSEFRSDPATTQAEALMLTGDLNMALVEWVVQYRISDPVAYLFKIQEPEKTLRDVSESVMRQVVGDRSVDQVLTVGRVSVEAEAKIGIQKTLDEYDSGISIEQVKLKNVNPPEAVQDSFNDVNKATQDRQRLENQALSAYNQVIPKAQGEANRIIEESKGYKARRVNEARGDVERFLSIYAEYTKAPDVTRRRMYLEAMSKSMPKANEIILIDDRVGGSVLPLLNIDRGNLAGGAK